MVQDEGLAAASTLKEEGIKMFRFGEYEEATQHFQEALALYERSGDQRGQAEMLNNLGAVLTQQERWTQAAEALSKAGQIFESLGDESGQGQTLGNLGAMYHHQGESEKAVETLKQAIDLFRRADSADKEAATLRLVSRIRLGQARWLEALHFYDLSLACVQPPGLKERILRALLKIPFNLLSRPG
ncbi:MAG TPA: tetratricopeptide repeat protein [Chloroflexi bacterium]|nr:tetratricopeptide repeat protein [Chloroflexota bacterium]